MRITSVQQNVICTKTPSPTTTPFYSSPIGYPKCYCSIMALGLSTEMGFLHENDRLILVVSIWIMGLDKKSGF